MQEEINALGLPVPVQVHGVNQIGHESANESACQGKDLPWLQEVPDQLVWGPWKVGYRDVIILNEENEVVATFNLTDHNLVDAAEYATLKNMLIGFAGGN